MARNAALAMRKFGLLWYLLRLFIELTVLCSYHMPIWALPITSKPIEGRAEQIAWQEWQRAPQEEQMQQKFKNIMAKSIFTLPLRQCPPNHELYMERCIPLVNINPSELLDQEILSLLGEGGINFASGVTYDYTDENYGDDLAILEQPLPLVSMQYDSDMPAEKNSADIPKIPSSMSINETESQQATKSDNDDMPFKFNIFQNSFSTSETENATNIDLPENLNSNMNDIFGNHTQGNTSTTTTKTTEEMLLAESAPIELQADATSMQLAINQFTNSKNGNASSATKQHALSEIYALALPTTTSQFWESSTNNIDSQPSSDETTMETKTNHTSDFVKLLENDALFPAFVDPILPILESKNETHANHSTIELFTSNESYEEATDIAPVMVFNLINKTQQNLPLKATKDTNLENENNTNTTIEMQKQTKTQNETETEVGAEADVRVEAEAEAETDIDAEAEQQEATTLVITALLVEDEKQLTTTLPTLQTAVFVNGIVDNKYNNETENNNTAVNVTTITTTTPTLPIALGDSSTSYNENKNDNISLHASDVTHSTMPTIVYVDNEEKNTEIMPTEQNNITTVNLPITTISTVTSQRTLEPTSTSTQITRVTAVVTKSSENEKNATPSSSSSNSSSYQAFWWLPINWQISHISFDSDNDNNNNDNNNNRSSILRAFTDFFKLNNNATSITTTSTLNTRSAL